MSEPTSPSDAVGVAAILASRAREDRAELIEDLVALLIAVLPDVEVKRALLSRKVQSVRAVLGDRAYVLERGRGEHFEARRQQVVRSVVIRNEPIDIDVFIAELSAALDDEARRSERGRTALETWLRSNP